jgi:Domain of unknown function (DUF1707)
MGGQLAFPGSVRASDSDRERAVALLRRHYAAGRLTLAELESRTARAYGGALLLWHRTKSRAATRRLTGPSAQASWRRA